ncbi:YqgE/AlgH family protein [Pseudophaeobacter arcticus]|jgi:putative transcriptional regulator|uniref:YqgE/AlgH family protein n=1 Tax=Pseudophaeobacter arcticus TaxID=385492 RepID=UPI00040F0D53|nr:YqgE/AlgH family protein [Pseudophaeobacter arcticus]
MDFTGKLLIAMPGIGDPRFEHSVIFLCSHTEDGAMGLIINKVAPEVQLSNLLDQLEIPVVVADKGKEAIRFGGPMEVQRGFVLHSPEYESSINSLSVPPGYGMTATLDILEDIAQGSGPQKFLIMLGYAGWGPGQLEAEIIANGWLTTESTDALIFDTADSDKWEAALGSLGIDPLTLSASAGTA